MAVALDLHVLADGDRAGAGHSPEVIAAEVHEHDVLGPLLGIALELLGEQGVLAGVGAARAGAGDRVGGQPVAFDLEQQLRRGAHHLERRRPGEEEIGARVDAPERAVEPDAVQRGPGRRVRRELERLPSSQHDLDRLAGRDRVLGHLDRVDVLVPPEAGLGGRTERGRRDGSRGRPGAVDRPWPTVQLRRARSRRSVERVEDGLLRDAIATLEVGRVRVERGDRRQRVGQVVEDEDEVGLDERGHRDADRVALRERDRALERGDGVVRERSDGATGEPRHAVGRLDAPTRHERADGGQRVVRLDRLDRQVGGIGRLRDGPGLDPRLSTADLEEAPRPHAEERIPPEALAALDQFEEVGRTAVVETQECPDRGLEVGRARGAEQDRVRVGGETLGLRQADRIGCRHRWWPRRIKTTLSSPGRKVVPSAVPPSFGDAALA